MPPLCHPAPLLPLAADGAPLVSAAAQAAVGGVCWWCGYGGSLPRLVAANADYVVDGLCARLRQVRGIASTVPTYHTAAHTTAPRLPAGDSPCARRARGLPCSCPSPTDCACWLAWCPTPPCLQLDAYPQAPQLFTALLQQAGVAPQLLPLLAEPARNAVQVGGRVLQEAGGCVAPHFAPARRPGAAAAERLVHRSDKLTACLPACPLSVRAWPSWHAGSSRSMCWPSCKRWAPWPARLGRWRGRC